MNLGVLTLSLSLYLYLSVPDCTIRVTISRYYWLQSNPGSRSVPPYRPKKPNCRPLLMPGPLMQPTEIVQHILNVCIY